MRNGLNLMTLSTHYWCNHAFKDDEEYFVRSLGPLAMQTPTGHELWQDIQRATTKPEAKAFAWKIYREFDPRPSGLYLPYGKVAKRFKGRRVHRVIYKIAQGL